MYVLKEKIEFIILQFDDIICITRVEYYYSIHSLDVIMDHFEKRGLNREKNVFFFKKFTSKRGH